MGSFFAEVLFLSLSAAASRWISFTLRRPSNLLAIVWTALKGATYSVSPFLRHFNAIQLVMRDNTNPCPRLFEQFGANQDTKPKIGMIERVLLNTRSGALQIQPITNVANRSIYIWALFVAEIGWKGVGDILPRCSKFHFRADSEYPVSSRLTKYNHEIEKKTRRCSSVQALQSLSCHVSPLHGYPMRHHHLYCRKEEISPNSIFRHGSPTVTLSQMEKFLR